MIARPIGLELNTRAVSPGVVLDLLTASKLYCDGFGQRRVV